MGDLPLRTPTHRRLGGPLPRQLANAPHGHPPPPWISRKCHAAQAEYGVLGAISRGYPPVAGRFHTCYSPVRRSPAAEASFRPDAPRLACVRPVASVHPEPGSNSPLLLCCLFFFSELFLLSKRVGNSASRSPYPDDAQIYRIYLLKNRDVDSAFLFLVSLTVSCLSQSFQ